MLLGVRFAEAVMSRWVMAMRLAGVGFFIGVSIAGGAFAGWWLGGGKIPFMIIGLVAGLVLAAYGVYQMLKPLITNKQNKENN